MALVEVTEEDADLKRRRSRLTLITAFFRLVDNLILQIVH